MRIFLATFLTIFILFGTYGYTKFTDSIRHQTVEVLPEYDDSQWSLSIDRTCECVPDPDLGTDALVVQFKGNDVVRSSKNIPPEQAVLIENLEGVEQGDNEILIEATLATLETANTSSRGPQAIRIRLRRGRKNFSEETIWIEAEETELIESVHFYVPRQGSQDEVEAHDHEH